MTSEIELLKQAANHWSGVSKQVPLYTRWWTNQKILRHINTRVCGQPFAHVSKGLTHRVKEEFANHVFEKGVSIGRGNGAKEISLIRDGLVETFDLYEISETRVAQGQEIAKKFGLENQVTFYLEDGFKHSKKNSYDLVHWNNSLHHMFDSFEAVDWSDSVLKSGGLFLMDDYVGPNRLQWTDINLEYASRCLAALPEHLMIDPMSPGKLLPRHARRPDEAALIARDPTEAPDSENILAAVEKTFPDATIQLTGGCLYHLALNDVMANFGPEEDALLQTILLADDALCEAGMTHYAIAYARKN